MSGLLPTSFTSIAPNALGSLIGSQSELKPSLKLDFAHERQAQHLHGLVGLALNNSRADRTFARTCLAYRVFAAAGYHFALLLPGWRGFCVPCSRRSS